MDDASAHPDLVAIVSDEEMDRIRQASHEAVARRAYELYLARGSQPGRDLEDWFRAEQELRA